MNKNTIIILITIILITSVVSGFWYVNSSRKFKVQSQKFVEQTEISKNDSQKNNNQDANQNTNSNIKYNPNGTINTSDWKTYRNEELGFEMKLPGDLNKWNIKVKYYNKEQSKYTCGEYFVDFNYKIDVRIPSVVPTSKDTSQISYLKRKEDRLFLLNVVPTRCYTDKIELLNLRKPLPPTGKEIDRNSRFVFLVLPSSLTEPLCTYVDDIERQKSDFCRIENIFATTLNISKLLNFKSINQ